MLPVVGLRVKAGGRGTRRRMEIGVRGGAAAGDESRAIEDADGACS
jgi:hypothetical protein